MLFLLEFVYVLGDELLRCPRAVRPLASSSSSSARPSNYHIQNKQNVGRRGTGWAKLLYPVAHQAYLASQTGLMGHGVEHYESLSANRVGSARLAPCFYNARYGGECTSVLR